MSEPSPATITYDPATGEVYVTGTNVQTNEALRETVGHLPKGMSVEDVLRVLNQISQPSTQAESLQQAEDIRNFAKQ